MVNKDTTRSLFLLRFLMNSKNSAVAAASSTPAVLEVFNGSEIEQKGSQDLHEPCDNVHNDPSVNDSIINQDLYEEVLPYALISFTANLKYYF